MPCENLAYDVPPCSEMLTCCDCGFSADGCGCRYCWSCNACDACNGDDLEESR